MTPEEQEELARIYQAENGQEFSVCLAFVRADEEPPSREQSKLRGFNSRELKILARYYPHHDRDDFLASDD